jgi:hypothetical protein
LRVKGATIGVRPELNDEIRCLAGVEKFHIYNTEGFLKYANKQIKAGVGTEAINEVREVVAASDYGTHRLKPLNYSAISVDKSVYAWLKNKFGSVEFNRRFPGFVVHQDDIKLGFEVRMVRNLGDLNSVVQDMTDIVRRTIRAMLGKYFYEISIVIVVLDPKEIDYVKYLVAEKLNHALEEMKMYFRMKLRIIFGSIEPIESEDGVREVFRPYDEVMVSKLLKG